MTRTVECQHLVSSYTSATATTSSGRIYRFLDQSPTLAADCTGMRHSPHLIFGRLDKLSVVHIEFFCVRRSEGW